MRIEKIYPRGFAANSYIVTSGGKQGVVIDPSGDWVYAAAMQAGLEITHVLLTHGHYDHVGGVNDFRKSNAQVLCGVGEKTAMGTSSLLFHYAEEAGMRFPIDAYLADGEEMLVDNLRIQCIAAPGHTAGSCLYLIMDTKTGEEALFTGDTLFLGTIGRTDLPTGNVGEMMSSLRKITAFSKNYPVYAGHGEDTTLEDEKRGNPYLQR